MTAAHTAPISRSSETTSRPFSPSHSFAVLSMTRFLQGGHADSGRFRIDEIEFKADGVVQYQVLERGKEFEFVVGNYSIEGDTSKIVTTIKEGERVISQTYTEKINSLTDSKLVLENDNRPLPRVVEYKKRAPQP